MFAFHCVTNPPFTYPFLCRWALGWVSLAVDIPMHASGWIHVTPTVGVHLGMELKVYLNSALVDKAKLLFVT